MQTVAAGQGVEIDPCGECGAIWLDAGELETLIAGHAPAPDAPLRALLEAALEGEHESTVLGGCSTRGIRAWRVVGALVEPDVEVVAQLDQEAAVLDHVVATS
jgi:hypothetical protein